MKPTKLIQDTYSALEIERRINKVFSLYKRKYWLYDIDIGSRWKWTVQLGESGRSKRPKVVESLGWKWTVYESGRCKESKVDGPKWLKVDGPKVMIRSKLTRGRPLSIKRPSTFRGTVHFLRDRPLSEGLSTFDGPSTFETVHSPPTLDIHSVWIIAHLKCMKTFEFTWIYIPFEFTELNSLI